MMAKILIVEDDPALKEVLEYNLAAEGFEVSHAGTGMAAETLVREQVPDLIVLDWMLPDTTGIELCSRWRAFERTSGMLVLMLTARAGESDRIEGLAAGADDYVVKPFSLPELMARVRALLRRHQRTSPPDIVTVGDIQLDRAAHAVRRGPRLVRMGPTEYKLLDYFVRNRGRVLTRDQVLGGVWGRDSFVDERTVDVHIGRLRRALNRGKDRDPFRTVRGVGYAFGDR